MFALVQAYKLHIHQMDVDDQCEGAGIFHSQEIHRRGGLAKGSRGRLTIGSRGESVSMRGAVTANEPSE